MPAECGAMNCTSKTCDTGDTHSLLCGSVPCFVADVSGLCCSFPDGVKVPAVYDAEGHTFTCVRQTGADQTDASVVDQEGKVVCEGKAICKMDDRTYFEVEGKEPVAQADEATGNEGRKPDYDSEERKPDFGEDGIGGKLSFLDKFLYVWIFLAMVAGVLVSEFAPEVKDAFEVAKIENVSITIAVGLWAMMYPVLCKVKYEILPTIFRSRHIWQQLSFSIFLNWVVGPLLMTGLAWATLPDLDGYRNGVILVGIARCIAMVLIWNGLARGDAEYCAILVAVNSVLQMVLFAPLALFYLQVVSRQYLDDDDFSIGFWTVCKNVLLYLGAPLAAAIITRFLFLWTTGAEFFDKKVMPWLGPWALIGLLYTIFVMFTMQGSNVIDNIGEVFRTAVPMVLYFSIMWTLTLFLARKLRFTYPFAVTQAFTASSNNFELAIAVAVGTFGIQSQEALAATVGPLIEVPVLLALVYVALWLRKKVYGNGMLFVDMDGATAQCGGGGGVCAGGAVAAAVMAQNKEASAPSEATKATGA